MDMLKRYIRNRIDNTRKDNERLKQKYNRNHWDDEQLIYNNGQIECMLDILENISRIEYNDRQFDKEKQRLTVAGKYKNV